MPPTKPYDPFMDTIPFLPLGETYWLGQMPPLDKAWEDRLWAQIEQWKQEQRETGQRQGELRRVG